MIHVFNFKAMHAFNFKKQYIHAFNFKSNTTLALSIFVPRKVLFRAFLGQEYKHDDNALHFSISDLRLFTKDYSGVFGECFGERLLDFFSFRGESS